MNYPVIINKAANGYILSPQPIDDEFPPDAVECHVFADLESLFQYLADDGTAPKELTIDVELEGDRDDVPLTDFEQTLDG